MIEYVLSFVAIIIIILIAINTKNFHKDRESQNAQIHSIKLIDIEENDFILKKEFESLRKYKEEKYSTEKNSKK